MILLAALLMMQAYSPETEAVMNRSRERAAEKRAAKAAEAGAADADAATSANARQGVDKPMPMAPDVAAKFQACLDAGTSDPDAGIRFAEAWRIDKGGFHARECMGFSLARAERWPAALVALEQAADDAERAGSVPDGARLWAQAGNAALAGGDAAKAKSDFDAALARGLQDGVGKGEVQLDRARAMVALKDLPAARTDLDNALGLVPQDPLAWLLSATLARRMNDLPLAQKHIAQAVKLSPDDASVALEEGNIAILSSHEDVAKLAWERALKLSPDSGPGKAAAANLTQLAAEKPAK
jgi:tetratricopeptide (TPR) repeat protein